MAAFLWLEWRDVRLFGNRDEAERAKDAAGKSFRGSESFRPRRTSRLPKVMRGAGMTGGSADLEALSRLMAEVRPRLHRYCARMVGSVFDGEDILQEALAKATEALPSAGSLAKAESWLFTIAHNTALDALRRRKRQAEVPLDSDSPDLPDAPPEAEAWVGATASLATLMQLPPLQRSSVVLLDVLEYSLGETVEILGTTLPAVKAALHRGRVRLKALADAGESSPPPAALAAEEQERLRSYAERFNARDFDALRNLLAEDVRLDLVN